MSPRIITDYWQKPIPPREFDWSAVLDNYEGGDPVGFGATEQEAINDLLQWYEDDEQLRFMTETGK
jgi:hypothetical protein